MARKKSETFQEDPDAAAVDVEISGDEFDEPLDKKNPRVTLNEKAPPPEPELSETTKAEQEAGRKTVEEKSKSQTAETDPAPEETT